MSAHQHSPGVISHTASIKTPIGLFPSSNDPNNNSEAKLKKFAALLEAGGMPAPIYSSAEMQIQRWEKLVWNAAFNSFTAITGLNTRTWLRSSDDAIPMTKRLMKEIIAVAHANGVLVRKDLDEILVNQVSCRTSGSSPCNG
jgi:ketopantoate reductase